MLTIWRFWPLGMILAAALPVQAETLYRWTTETGVPVYSNVSPPAGVKDFSQVAGRASAGERDRSAGAAPAVSGETAARMDVDGPPDPAPDPGPAFFQARIERREAAVREIETLLRASPGDTSLRRHLQEKRQSIQEDRVRLKLMTR